MKRALLFFVVVGGVETLCGQPATAPRENPSLAQSSSNAVSTTGAAMNAENERKAREMLDKLAGPAPASAAQSTPSVVPPSTPGVAAAPPDLEAREAARQKALLEAKQAAAAQPANASVGTPSPFDTAREKEISRIEAEIEAARKRREAAAGTQPVAVPVVNTRPVVVQAPSGNSGVTPVTDTRGLGVLEAQTGPAKAAVGTPVLTAEVGAPSAPANPAGPTLTPEAEAKARELLRRNMYVIFSDKPAPQVTVPKSTPLPSASGASVTAPAAVLPPPAGASQRSTEVLPPPAAKLEVPANSSAGSVAPATQVELPKAQPVAPPPAAVPPPAEIPAPNTAPRDSAAIAPERVPSTPSSPEEEAARVRVREAVADLRATPPVSAAAPTTGAITIPPVEPPPAGAAVPAAAAVAPPSTASGMTPEQEARARELLLLQGAQTARVPAATPPVAPVVTTAPAYTPPPVMATPPPLTSPVQAAVPSSVPASSAIAGLTPDTESKARQLVTQQVAEVRRGEDVVLTPAAAAPVGGTASIPANGGSPEELKAKRELIKQQEREGKKRRAEEKKLEDAAKKQAAKLDQEATVKAREVARKQLEDEAKARQSGKSISSKAGAATTPFQLAPGTKRQRLDQLTDAYVHDRIGPEEYHRERAKIIAEPGE